MNEKTSETYAPIVSWELANTWFLTVSTSYSVHILWYDKTSNATWKHEILINSWDSYLSWVALYLGSLDSRFLFSTRQNILSPSKSARIEQGYVLLYVIYNFPVSTWRPNNVVTTSKRRRVLAGCRDQRQQGFLSSDSAFVCLCCDVFFCLCCFFSIVQINSLFYQL